MREGGPDGQACTLGPVDLSAGPVALVDRRLGPHDGCVYSYLDFVQRWAADHTGAAIAAYWAQACTPLAVAQRPGGSFEARIPAVGFVTSAALPGPPLGDAHQRVPGARPSTLEQVLAWLEHQHRQHEGLLNRSPPSCIERLLAPALRQLSSGTSPRQRMLPRLHLLAQDAQQHGVQLTITVHGDLRMSELAMGNGVTTEA